ncbi:M48 family metallopeptidase [Staphylococcus simulans]|uniref:M48 family metallopeptidase n=1 Tax=Staphylococcus simulans TaxID=1286 RepID=UPI003CF4AA59
MIKYGGLSFLIHATPEMLGLFIGAYIGLSNWGDIKNNYNQYLSLFILGIILIIFAGAFETYITPFFTIKINLDKELIYMRIISLLLLILAVLLKFDVLSTPFLSYNLKKYMFAFSFGLFFYAFLKPHVDLIFVNKKRLTSKFVTEYVPELTNKKISFYSVSMPFKPNLFAVKKKESVIIIDDSLIQKLNENELRFFLLHEYSHIKDNDSLKMHLVSLSAFTLTPFVFFLLMPIIKLPSNIILLLIVVFLFILVYFIIIALNFKFKRNCELKCDTYASEYVNTKYIKSAFEKFIELGIFDYKSRSILSSHPSLNERLNNLNININNDNRS